MLRDTDLRDPNKRAITKIKVVKIHTNLGSTCLVKVLGAFSRVLLHELHISSLAGLSSKACHKIADVATLKLVITASKIENLLPVLASRRDNKRRTLVLSGLSDLDLTLNVEPEQTAISELLRQDNKPQLRSLDLSRNQLGLPCILALAQGLILNQAVGSSNMKSLSTLNLSRNKLGPQGTKLLCESLREHSGLHRLDLSHNYLGDEGCMTMAKLLEKRKKVAIQKLKLSFNKITGDGVIPLFNALTKRKGVKSSTVSHLCLDGNYIFNKNKQVQDYLLRLLESDQLAYLNVSGVTGLPDRFFNMLAVLLKNK